MSVITKPCDTCAGNGRPVTFWNGVVDCADCAGTGRIPDVEATLRAELDAARAEVERLRDIIRHNAPVAVGVCSPTANAELDKRDAEIARLTAEVDRMTTLYRKADDGHDENMRETARLIGEVERLTAREREAASVMRAHLNGDATNRMCAAWLAGCKTPEVPTC